MSTLFIIVFALALSFGLTWVIVSSKKKTETEDTTIDIPVEDILPKRPVEPVSPVEPVVTEPIAAPTPEVEVKKMTAKKRTPKAKKKPNA